MDNACTVVTGMWHRQSVVELLDVLTLLSNRTFSNKDLYAVLYIQSTVDIFYRQFYLLRFVEKNLNEGEFKMNLGKYTFASSLKTDCWSEWLINWIDSCSSD